MFYEMRTYSLKPGAVPDFEEVFEKRQPFRERHSKLGGFWHTEFGRLNQVIHIWPYESLEQRSQVRDAMAQDEDLRALPLSQFIDEQETEFLNPVSFMRPMEPAKLGSFYELRMYSYRRGNMPEVLRRWSLGVPVREKYSPMAGCWTTDMGPLNKLVHLWPYNSFEERERIRAESSKEELWPPPTSEFMIKQETKILLPASFSPMQ